MILTHFVYSTFPTGLCMICELLPEAVQIHKICCCFNQYWSMEQESLIEDKASGFRLPRTGTSLGQRFGWSQPHESIQGHSQSLIAWHIPDAVGSFISDSRRKIYTNVIKSSNDRLGKMKVATIFMQSHKQDLWLLPTYLQYIMLLSWMYRQFQTSNQNNKVTC